MKRSFNLFCRNFHRVFAVIVVSFVCFSVFGKDYEFKGQFKNEDGAPIDSVLFSFKMDDDIIAKTYSSSDGSFSLEVPEGVYKLEAIKQGYLAWIYDAYNHGVDFWAGIILEKDPEAAAKELEEVEVIADALKSFADRDEMYLTSYNRKFGVNALDAISSLPLFEANINATSLRNTDQEDVNILIDGRRASARELQNLKGNDIAKVVYYAKPPAKYAALFGDAPVANVILRRPKAISINGGIDAGVALTYPQTSNNVNFTVLSPKVLLTAYNSFMYGKPGNRESTLSYDYGDMTNLFKSTKLYEEEKNNTTAINLQYDHGRNMFYAGFTYATGDAHGEDNYQLAEITRVGTLYGSRNNRDHSIADRLTLNLYYSHDFGNESSLMADVVGTLNKGSNRSRLEQRTDEDMTYSDYLIDSSTSADVKSIIANIAYNFTILGGNASAAVSNDYTDVSQNYLNNFFPELPSHNVSSRNTGWIKFTYNRNFGKLGTSLNLSLYDLYTKSPNGENYNELLFYPRLSFDYKATNWLNLFLMGWMESTSYGLGQQNINRTFIDTRYFSENIEYMKNSRRYRIMFRPRFSLFSNRLYLTPSVIYTWHCDAYINYIYNEDGVFISRPTLIPHKNEVNFRLNAMWMAAPGLRIQPMMVANHQAYRTPGGKERFNAVYGSLNVSYVLKHWQFQVMAETPSHTLNGLTHYKSGWYFNAKAYWTSPKFYAGLGYSFNGQKSSSFAEVPGFITESANINFYQRYQFNLFLGYNFQIGKYNRRAHQKGLQNASDETGLGEK